MSETPPNDWDRENAAYLSAALAWLRLLLQRQAQETAPRQEPSGRRGPFAWLFRRWRRAPPHRRVTEADIERAAQAMADAAEIEPPPALLALSARLGLTLFEQQTLLLCAAVELDTRIAALCAGAQGDAQRAYPTFALALALFGKDNGGSGWEAILPDRPLRYWRLVEIHQPGAQPLTVSPLRADERIVNYVKGLNYLDDRLAPLLVPFDPSTADPGPLPPSQQAVAEAIVRRLEQATHDGRAPILQLVGVDPLSKQLVARQALAQRRLLARLPAELLPAQAAELETLARLWQRESMLLPIALYLDAHETLEPQAEPSGQHPAPHRLLSRDLGLVLLDTREVQPGLGPYSLPIDVEKPTPAEQQQAWSDALGPDAVKTAGQLAGQFDLNLPTIRQIARSVTDNLPDGETPTRDQVWQACLQHTRPRLDRLAQRIESRAGWEDLVLPKEPFELLEQISAQVGQRSQVYDGWGFRRKMNRGLGISALFSGMSGTGKTMAAEVIARDLQLNLYRIDLSAVVSKYIGETEKNLRQVFDAAEDGGAILFFDEADALFGKRSEVKDSHDRYANIEVNYLLQRMEAYRGLAILATNMRSALDPAFLRRLRFIVTFPFPNPDDRRRIWHRVFPLADPQQDLPGTPTEALDDDFLARLHLTGGSIHNVALNAAFAAAHAGTPVTMPLLIAAARTELRKLDTPISEADFRPPGPAQVRRASWPRLLAARAGAEGVALGEIDYDRLAWFDLDEQEIAGFVERSVQDAARAGEPLTMDHILRTIQGQRAPEATHAAQYEPQLAPDIA